MRPIKKKPGSKERSFTQTETIDDIVHFFFDDTGLADDVDECIGLYVRDAREAAYIRSVVEAMDIVLSKYGTKSKDAEYVTMPEWQHVLVTAKAALAVVSEPGPGGEPA